MFRLLMGQNQSNDGNSDSEDDSSSSESDSSDSDATDDEVIVERWHFMQNFANLTEAKQFIKADGDYSVRSSVSLANEKKTLMRCTHTRKLGEQCARKYYFLSPKVTDVNVDANMVGPAKAFFNNMPHTCNESANKSKVIPDKIKGKILEVFKNFQKPKQICLELSVDPEITDDEIPTLKDVRNVIRNKKDEIYGRGAITMGELTNFVEAHQAVPDNEDHAYVVAFERSAPNIQPSDAFYRLFISTKRLLRQSAAMKNIHADATKKITTDNNPLLVVGCTDAAKKFHLTGWTISSHETGDAYRMSFEAAKKGVLQVTGSELTPEVLISDADPAIRNGCRAAFNDPEFPHAMCWAHVVRNVVTKYKFLNPTQNKTALMDDLRVLHCAYSTELFDTGCQLFITKWKGIEPHVIDKIDKSFIQQNNTWYIGFKFQSPITDNSLENHNGDIKKFQTDHKKKPLKEFLPSAIRMMHQRSREYLSIPKPPFQTDVKIPNDVLIAGTKFQRSFVYTVQKDQGRILFYMFSSEEQRRVNRDITQKDVEDFRTMRYNTFDEFKANAFRIWCIKFAARGDDWLQKTICTCPAYDVHYVCKHIVHLALVYNMPNIEPAIIPEEEEPQEPNFDDQPLVIAKTKKAGRPKKATPALQTE